MFFDQRPLIILGVSKGDIHKIRYDLRLLRQDEDKSITMWYTFSSSLEKI